MNFTIGSLFDGSGGFPLAASMCGGTPKWASEVEPYPIAVTKSRFPNVKHLGSVTDIKGGEVEPVDVITFGSPCQDLSVAGKRAGLKHEANGDDETTRSGLFMEAVRIIKEMREATNGVYPRFALWENVPGAFSSNKGEDFRIVLEELIKIVEPTAVMPPVPKEGWPYADSYCGDGWSLAYRVLDAQFWGVPQRRRRIYLVADFRGECAGKVSFEREGLRGYFAEGGTPWQAAPGDAEAGSGAADCTGNGVNILNPWDSQGNQVHDGTDNHIYPCLRGCGGAGYQAGYVLAPTGFEGHNGSDTGDKAATLGVNCGTSTGRNGVICMATHGNLPCVMSIENHPADSRVNIDATGKVQTLTSRMGTGGGNVPMVMESHPIMYWDGGQTVATLTANNAGGNQRMPDKENFNCVIECHGVGTYQGVVEALCALDYKWVQQQQVEQDKLIVEATNLRYIVRRLTPTECARLQGFPDTWGHPNHKDDFTDEEYQFWLNVRNTHATINGKATKDYTQEQILKWYNGLHTDSSEYKMWGNGIALPNALYVMQGIADVMSEEKAARRKWLMDLLGDRL